MRANEFDLLVIGEGLAGICAAAAAARSGMRVMLAGKGPGNFVLGSACVDLGGITSAELPALDCSPKRLEEALAFFVDLCTAAGCSYDGGILEQRLIPTVMGTFQTASFAPRSLWKGDPRTVAKVAVIGIDNLSAFDADFVAEQLYFHTQQKGLSTSYRSATIRLQDLQRPLTTVDIATRWDRNPAYQKAGRLPPERGTRCGGADSPGRSRRAVERLRFQAARRNGRLRNLRTADAAAFGSRPSSVAPFRKSPHRPWG